QANNCDDWRRRSLLADTYLISKLFQGRSSRSTASCTMPRGGLRQRLRFHGHPVYSEQITVAIFEGAGFWAGSLYAEEAENLESTRWNQERLEACALKFITIVVIDTGFG
ncbi:unnamed protein product, partial [Amoebophrya sp. A25]